MNSSALVAVYVPLVVFAVAAVYVYARHVLWPAWRTRSLSMREHGIVLGFVLAFVADAAENVYYGVGRLSPDVYSALAWSLPPVVGLKVLILAGSMCAISGYWHATRGRGVMWQLAWLALAIWAAATLLLTWWRA